MSTSIHRVRWRRAVALAVAVGLVLIAAWALHATRTDAAAPLPDDAAAASSSESGLDAPDEFTGAEDEGTAEDPAAHDGAGAGNAEWRAPVPDAEELQSLFTVPQAELDESALTTLIEVVMTGASTVAPLADSGQVDDLFSQVAEGPFREELEAEWAQMNVEGWSVEGTPEVRDVTILSVDDERDPRTATVSACISTEGLAFMNADGETHAAEHPPAPALHLLTLRQTDGVWRVSERTFPDDPAC